MTITQPNVRPDIVIKRADFFKKNCLKRCHFNLKMKSFQNIPKVNKYSGYFLRRSANKNFQKSPDLVTLTPLPYYWLPYQRTFTVGRSMTVQLASNLQVYTQLLH